MPIGRRPRTMNPFDSHLRNIEVMKKKKAGDEFPSVPVAEFYRINMGGKEKRPASPI